MLAQVRSDAGRYRQVDYPYDYVREYPQGPLFADITGYDSALYYGSTGIEKEYDSYLGAHQQAPQTLSQLLFRQKMPTTTDNVTLTVEPSLQNAAWQALTHRPGANNDGAVVVLNPKTGAVLAMVSNPTYDPNTLAIHLVQAEQLAYSQLHHAGPRGLLPLRPSPPGVLLSRFDHEGGDLHRGLQPQAFAGGLRLSGPALPELLRLEPVLQRRLCEQTPCRAAGP